MVASYPRELAVMVVWCRSADYRCALWHEGYGEIGHERGFRLLIREHLAGRAGREIVEDVMQAFEDAEGGQ